MPSKTFQPLLFDNFLYKLPNTTYVDHYSQRGRNQFFNLRKSYNNLSQKEKMALLQKRARPFTCTSGATPLDNTYQQHEPTYFINGRSYTNKNVRVCHIFKNMHSFEKTALSLESLLFKKIQKF